MHDLDQDPERLLFRHLEQQRRNQEALSLTVPNFGIVDRVSFGDAIKRLLPDAAGFLEELMRGKGPEIVKMTLEHECKSSKNVFFYL